MAKKKTKKQLEQEAPEFELVMFGQTGLQTCKHCNLVFHQATMGLKQGDDLYHKECLPSMFEIVDSGILHTLGIVK